MGGQGPIMIAVLLSTHNGAKFLSELFESILLQTRKDFTIFVRDDSSSDSTRQIIQDLCKSNENIFYIRDNLGRLGPKDSFHILLSTALADRRFEYFAFCDQDDIWFEQKLERAVASIGKRNDPTLYFSNFIIGENLSARAQFFKAPLKVGFGNALVENVAIGATQVLNRQASEIVACLNWDNAIMHDSFCYSVISACGVILSDDLPNMMYRTHDNNFYPRKWRRFRNLANLRKIRLDSYFKQAQSIFAQSYKIPISENNLEFLQFFLNISNSPLAARMRIIKLNLFWRQKWYETYLIKTVMIFFPNRKLSKINDI